jgi:hypothetical protein
MQHKGGIMFKRLLFIALLLPLLIACGGTSLDSLIETPVGYGTFVASMPWRIYPDIPTSNRVSYREIYQGAKTNEVGHISIVRYDTVDGVAFAWKAILVQVQAENKPYPVNGLGEQAVSTGPTVSWNNSDVLFVRCMTVVHLTYPEPLSTVEEYARQLDKRLSQSVC